VRDALTVPWSTEPVEGHNSSTEAEQTSEVRAGQTRFVTDSRIGRSLVSPGALHADCGQAWLTSPNCGRTGFEVITEGGSNTLVF